MLASIAETSKSDPPLLSFSHRLYLIYFQFLAVINITNFLKGLD